MGDSRRFFGGALIVFLLAFSGCSKRENPPEETPPAPEAAEGRAAFAGQAAVGERGAAAEGEPSVSPGATRPVGLSAAAAAGQQGGSAEAPWTAQMELERSPLDLQRLLEGIWEKYELDELETPEVLKRELLDRFYAGDMSVATDLGILIAYGDPNEGEPALAKEILEEAAADGDVRAISELGRLYLSGRGVPQDGPLAQAYFERAKAAGDLDGTFLLGMGHRIGLWEEADTESGLVLLETAASLGYVAAANSLFGITQGGSEGTMAERLAAYPDLERWLSAGVDAGDIRSMLNLSEYYKGLGEPAKRMPLLKAAAELGSFDALEDLMHLSWPQMKNAAFRDSFKELLRPHAELGTGISGTAYYRLATLELLGGPSRLAETEHLLQEAKARGYTRAEAVLQKMEDGVPAPHAFTAASKLSWEEVYVETTNRTGIKRVKDSGQGDTIFSALASGVQEAYGQWLESQGVARKEEPAPVQPQTPELSRDLKLKKMVEVRYPPELLADSISGEVLVELIIGKDGRVERSRVVESSHLGFEASALEAGEGIEFEPRMENGKPVRFMVRMPLVFIP